MAPDVPRGAPGPGPQQDALLPHRPGRGDRGVGGHRHGGHRRRRQGASRADLRGHGLEHAHRPPRQHHRRRHARRLRVDAHAHLGRSQGHPERRARGPLGRAAAARHRHHPVRGPELDHLGVRNLARLLPHPELARRARLRPVPVRRGLGDQGDRARADGGGQDLRPRGRPGGTGGAREEHPLHGDRGAREEGAVAVWPGLRRRGLRAHQHLSPEGPGRPGELHRRHHHGLGHQRRDHRARREPDALAACSPGRTTTSRSATSPSWPAPRRRAPGR